MEPRISLITLGVSDLERSLRFYREGLGLPASSAGGGEVIFFRTRGAVLALYPRAALAADANLPPEGTGFSGVALAHNVATKDEVDRVLEQARVAGGRLLKPGAIADWGGYSGYFADPDGYAWEVAWNPHFPIGADGGLILPE